MDPYKIIFHPFVTEKTMNIMEKNNSLEFVVRRNSNKKQKCQYTDNKKWETCYCNI